MASATLLRLLTSCVHAWVWDESYIRLPSASVANLRNMLGSCDNHARSEKRPGEMFRRHGEWPHVADAVIEADFDAL
jgi:hypothetical protein